MFHTYVVFASLLGSLATPLATPVSLELLIPKEEQPLRAVVCYTIADADALVNERIDEADVPLLWTVAGMAKKGIDCGVVLLVGPPPPWSFRKFYFGGHSYTYRVVNIPTTAGLVRGIAVTERPAEAE